MLRATTLLELDGTGRFTRLERDAADGLLTLHPEQDGRTVHGNRIRSGGVDPIGLAWTEDGGLRFQDDAFGSALCQGTGSWLVIAPDGVIRTDRPEAVASIPALAVDDRGVPRLDDAAEWPLEV